MEKRKLTFKNSVCGLASRLVIMLILMFVGVVGAMAETGQYVEWNSKAKTLTFKYGEKPTIDNKKYFNLDIYYPSGYNYYTRTVEKVVFDKSFASARPRTCKKWFSGFSELTRIEGIEFLNTSYVASMCGMFENCSKLTKIDLSNFETSNVDDMSKMFSGCTSLAGIPGYKNLDVSNVKYMDEMFQGCKFSSIDLSSWDTYKVSSMACMFKNCTSITSINLTGKFSTVNMFFVESMFEGCSSLAAIYTKDKFIYKLAYDSSDDDMFAGCTSLSGDIDWSKSNPTDKTYAKIDGGYFRDKSIKDGPWVKYSDGVLTFRYGYKKTFGKSAGAYKLNEGTNKPDWMNDHALDIKKVIFDKSFDKARPNSSNNWFDGCENLENIENIEFLNTSKITTMACMFRACYNLQSLDLSHFNTASVTDMSLLFCSCKKLQSINISSFNTENVKKMTFMFYDCKSLRVIVVGRNFKKSSGTDSQVMFYNTPANNLLSPIEEYMANDGDKTFGDANDRRTIQPYFPINAKAEYGTLCSPVGGTLEEGTFSGFDKLYEVDAERTNDSKVSLQLVSKVEAGKTYIYHRNITDDALIADALIFNIDKTKASAPQDGSILKGTFKSITAPGGSYILQTDGMFHRVADGNSTLKVEAYRAYLDLGSTGNGAKTMSLSFGGETTGIKNINAAEGESAEAPMYDLMGRRITNPQGGQIYIQNGRKIKR